jgi:hypothetical protein
VVTLLRFLVGILLVQGATALLVIAAVQSEQGQVRLLLGGLALAIGAIAAAGLTALAGAASQHALARAREGFSRERETLRVKAEQERSRLLQEGHRRVERARARSQGRAGLKVGVAVAGVLGAGVVLLFSQMVTLGLLALTAGGGAVAGYLVRARQDGAARERVWLTSLAARLRAGNATRLPPPGRALVPRGEDVVVVEPTRPEGPVPPRGRG